MTISINIIRKMILIALTLIVFSQIALWVAGQYNKIVAVVWGLVAAIGAFYCRRRATKAIKANKQFYIWMAIPAVLTLIAIILHLKQTFKSEGVSLWTILWDIMPVCLSFVLPVLLLWIAYASLEPYLSRKTNDPGNASAQSKSS